MLQYSKAMVKTSTAFKARVLQNIVLGGGKRGREKKTCRLNTMGLGEAVFAFFVYIKENILENQTTNDYTYIYRQIDV